VSIVQKGICQIEDLDERGRGTGIFEGQKVSLPYTVPGETIEFDKHIYRRKSNYILNKIISPSLNRIRPLCKYFGQCGGCVLQHLNLQEYTKFKESLIRKSLAEYQIQTNLLPIITIPPGNRRRANFEAVIKEDKLFMGFHKLSSHKIVDLDSCPALLPNLSKLIPSLKDLLSNILEIRQKAKIFVTQASNGIDVTFELYGQKVLSDTQKKQIEVFAETNNLIRAVFRARKFIDIVHQKEEPYVVFGDVKVPVDAYCFLQASFESDRILQNLILKHALGKRGVDLFCGRGTFLLPLSKMYSMDGFESDKNAVEALSSVIENLSVNIAKQDLFLSPLTNMQLSTYDFAVINPPRCGAETQVIELAKSNVKRIIYVSCNPSTFARDAKILVQNGYNLDQVQGVDQFYWSHHLEIVGVFAKSL